MIVRYHPYQNAMSSNDVLCLQRALSYYTRFNPNGANGAANNGGTNPEGAEASPSSASPSSSNPISVHPGTNHTSGATNATSNPPNINSPLGNNAVTPASLNLFLNNPALLSSLYPKLNGLGAVSSSPNPDQTGENTNSSSSMSLSLLTTTTPKAASNKSSATAPPATTAASNSSIAVN